MDEKEALKTIMRKIGASAAATYFAEFIEQQTQLAARDRGEPTSMADERYKALKRASALADKLSSDLRVHGV